MLFNSHAFLFLFLPITVLGFFLLGHRGKQEAAIGWLVAASLFFYGWWNPRYLLLIGLSILVNYGLGTVLGRRDRPHRGMLAAGVVFNLLLIGYFKYANFLVDSFNTTAGTDFHLEHIVLPLAISFFTFQQIAFLVDAHQGETREYNFLHYCLFVTFFPQLIAGPIVHHKEMLPQFADRARYRFNPEHFSVGLTVFLLGLFKKVVLADNMAVYATPVFDAAAAGDPITGFVAWRGALGYTLQLYFDFSGYSDMAIGLGRMFGVRLPLNFNQPYKAKNIIQFWRRWHMTLSRFLLEYCYIPLGGNRYGTTRRYINLMITMLLGGLWHGAGWTYVIWGGMHGVYLVINNLWLTLRRSWGHDLSRTTLVGRGVSQVVTFLAFAVSLVVFRSESMTAAGHLFAAMAGADGFVLPQGVLPAGVAASVQAVGIQVGATDPEAFRTGWTLIALLLGIAWYTPTIPQMMHDYQPALETYGGEFRTWEHTWIRWRPSLPWAVAVLLIAYVTVMQLDQISEFLYFQF